MAEVVYWMSAGMYQVNPATLDSALVIACAVWAALSCLLVTLLLGKR